MSNTHHRALAALTLLAVSAFAHAVQPGTAPGNTIEIKGGVYFPDAEDWANHYDKDWMPQFLALNWGHKFTRQLELGAGMTFGRAIGEGLAETHGTVNGHVNFQLMPLDLYGAYRAVYREKQTFVPYIAAGYTRMNYLVRISGQDNVRGAINGYHARIGLQILLDEFDSIAAGDFYQDYGVENTYLTFEAQKTKADDSDIDLGGTNYMAGLVFEY